MRAGFGVLLVLLAAPSVCGGEVELDSIWELQTVDADGIGIHPKVGADPTDDSNRAVVQGIALNASGELLGATMWQVYVQGYDDPDLGWADRGGIAAWAGEWFAPEWPLYPDVQPGDLVRITGFVATHRGKVNINSRHSPLPEMQFVVEILDHPGLPEPQVLPDLATSTTFDVDRRTGGERYQGQWCQLQGVWVDSGDWAAENSELLVTDHTGARLNLYLSGVGDFAGSQPPPGRFSVTGIFDQEDPDMPEIDHYRLWVKSWADILVWPEGEVDGNGCVNVTDLVLVRVNLGNTGSAIDPPAADIDGNGVVNVSDFVIVRTSLGSGCQ